METNVLAPVVEIFCDIDDFCKQWFIKISPYLLPNPNRKRQRTGRMSASEIMTIVILFHLSHYRTFKDYYRDCVEISLKPYFPKLVSYNRFVEIMALSGNDANHVSYNPTIPIDSLIHQNYFHYPLDHDNAFLSLEFLHLDW